MGKVNAFRSLLVAGGAVVVVAAGAFFLLTGRGADRAQTDGGATTETAAATAGAQVIPTAPKLKVEPK